MNPFADNSGTKRDLSEVIPCRCGATNIEFMNVSGNPLSFFLAFCPGCSKQASGESLVAARENWNRIAKMDRVAGGANGFQTRIS